MSDTDSVPRKDDSVLALTILVVAVVLVVVVGLVMWRRTKTGENSSWKQQSTFTPPQQKADYVTAKKVLDVNKVSEKDQLKQLLMKRALYTIPILLSLQNEGSSIERLYQRGMLTDDMHFKVKELKTYVDQELQEVQHEADELIEGWGQSIWPQAMQFYQLKIKQSEGKDDEQTPQQQQSRPISVQPSSASKQQSQPQQDSSSNNKKKDDNKKDRRIKPVEITDNDKFLNNSNSDKKEDSNNKGGKPTLTPEEVAKQLVEEEEREKAKKNNAASKQNNKKK